MSKENGNPRADLDGTQNSVELTLRVASTSTSGTILFSKLRRTAEPTLPADLTG